MSLPGDENPQWQHRPAPAWPPPSGQPQFEPSPPASGLAIASLILSISAFVALPLIGSIAGVVCGHLARSRMRREGRGDERNGLALAGVIIGWVGIAFYGGILALVLLLIAL